VTADVTADRPTDRPTIAQALQAARSAGVARLDALRLLECITGRGRTALLAHDEQPLDGPQAQRWHALLPRRAAGEPLAYLVGGREFHGLWLAVDARVLDPRPDTETLVDWALALLAEGDLPAPRVLDLGTGSGAIALALKQRCPAAEVVAVDLSDAALAVARRNGAALGLAVDWRCGSWFEALATQGRPLATDALASPIEVMSRREAEGGHARERFDLIVSNPPYLAEDDPHLPALQHEPRSALVAADAGLADLRLLVAQAPGWLRPGGHLLLEHGHTQGPAVAAAFAAAPGDWQLPARHQADLAGLCRCTGARRR
jgi:release factor glutamine methyltransferase